MSKRILYKRPDGGVSVIIPAPNCKLDDMSTALKDVPKGLPFKIVDTADVPSDRTFREAWELDEADLTDGVGADHGVQ